MSESTVAPQHVRGAAASPPGDLTEGLIATDSWTDQVLAEAGIPVIDVPFLTVGGGIVASRVLLVEQGFARKLGPGRSTGQWWKCVRNQPI